MEKEEKEKERERAREEGSRNYTLVTGQIPMLTHRQPPEKKEASPGPESAVWKALCLGIRELR